MEPRTVLEQLHAALAAGQDLRGISVRPDEVSADSLATDDSELFTRYPVPIAHSSQLAAVREYVADDATGIPVLAVRQTDNSVMAFLNVCRHRGVRVVTECEGQRRSFTCPYHGWTYGPDGGLRGIPYRQAFEAVNRAERSLRRLATEERHGMVWAQLTVDRLTDIDAYLGPELNAELGALDLEDLVLVRRSQGRVDQAWNVHLADAVHRFAASGSTLGTHRGPHLRFARLGGTGAGSSALDDLVLLYLLHPATLLIRLATHCLLATAYPDAFSPDARCVVRTSLLVPKDQCDDDTVWDRVWAEINPPTNAEENDHVDR